MATVVPTPAASTQRKPRMRTSCMRSIVQLLRGACPGHYSRSKSRALCSFLSTSHSRWHHARYLLGTPVMSLVLSILIECIPLADPTRGWQHAYAFFGRFYLAFMCGSFSFVTHARALLPALCTTWIDHALIANIQAVILTTQIVLIASHTDCFPVPFSSVLPVPLALACGGIVNLLVAKRRGVNIKDLLPKFQPIVNVLNAESVSLMLYPVSSVLFMQLSARQQTYASLVFPLLKLVTRHLLWQQVYALTDVAPVLISFTTHFTHALYSVVCLQAAKTTATIVVLISWTILQAAVVNQTFAKRCRTMRTTDASNTTFQDHLQQCLDQLDDPSLAPFYRHNTPTDKQQIFTIIPDKPKMDSSTATTTAQCLHEAEHMLLRAYIGVFVPIFYAIYMLIVLYLPVHAYYPALSWLSRNDSESTARLQATIGQLLLVSAIECLAFVSHLVTIQRALRLRSALDMLVFILKTQCQLIQCHLVPFALVTLSFPLRHCGNDLTFEFAWLQTPNH